ncbi:hypothetical protein Q4Q34_10330 [Flavivirga abyssicola]|uniref:hypothetical protein n=1 Tax=Flavivirga abyssicola TaxID=3063533 RepID=UPI0026DF0237|nr:hypothetical protein [Flavivirga sp. MEBiC07777]WVK11621.1 hypothetical protein Q4Q34_10330 [Flavivirga sp. MEBiC07777]
MAPIKFEESIKDKLDKRTLQPSNNAWNKLSERLSDQEKKKGKRPILWIGLAASIIGVMLVISQFFNDGIIVDDIHKTIAVPEVKEENKNNAVIVETNVNSVKASETIQINKDEVIKKSLKKPILNKSEFNKEQIADNQENNIKKRKNNPVNPVEVTSAPLTFEQEKIQAVASQIQALKDNNKVTDEAIDALLLEAQKEIRLNQLYNEATGVVDANLLLQDVEADLDQSFRSKVFEAIKTGYGAVKTTVAHRND